MSETCVKIECPYVHKDIACPFFLILNLTSSISDSNLQRVESALTDYSKKVYEGCLIENSDVEPLCEEYLSYKYSKIEKKIISLTQNSNFKFKFENVINCIRFYVFFKDLVEFTPGARIDRSTLIDLLNQNFPLNQIPPELKEVLGMSQ